jgi:hypothetical protein
MSIVNDFFEKNDHKVLVYFCFGDDGYARHRKITFNKWCKDLNKSIEKHDSTLYYEGSKIYGSLIILENNPLKKLILEAFNSYIEEINSDK